MKSQTRATAVWKEIKPFAIRDIGSMMEQAKSSNQAEGYFIILYDASGEVKREYSFSEDGLSAALAAAESGDVVWIPAGSISTIGGEIYSALSSVDSCRSYDGAPPEGWLELNYDDLAWNDPRENADHPDYTEGEISDATPLWSQSTESTGQACFRQKFSLGIVPGTATLEFNYDDHIDIYLNGNLIGSGDDEDVHSKSTVSVNTALLNTETENILCVWSNNNIATTDGGYVVWKLSIVESETLTIPSGVEVVGLGKNTVLDGSIVNEGKVTNLTVTGAISSGGEYFCYDSDGYLITNQQIDMGGQRIVDLDDPTEDQDAATKAYVDDQIAGFTIYAEAISNPPTENEIEGVLGDPATHPGRASILKDTETSLYYLVISNGSQYIYSPFITAILAEGPAGDPHYPENVAWCWFQDPRSVYYNGNTYVAFLTNTGVGSIAAYNHTSEQFGSTFSLNINLLEDDHASPAMLIRDSDKKILAFYCRHNGSGLYYRVSSSAEDVSAFAAEVNIDPTVGVYGYSYPMPVQLLGETNDPIYLFFRWGSASSYSKHWAYTKSEDGGATWSSYVSIFANGKMAYIKITPNGDDRIDFVLSDNNPIIGKTSLFHFYFTGGSYYDSEGTEITPPWADTSELTQVYDGSSISGWQLDIAIGADGHPRILYQTHPTEWSDARYNWARWTGSAWESHEVAQTAGSLYSSGGEPYTGGGMLDHEDPNICYLSRLVSGQYEIFKYVTADNGATWTPTQITSGSSAKNIRPIVPLNHASDLKVLWLFGTYTSYTNFEMEMLGDDT